MLSYVWWRAKLKASTRDTMEQIDLSKVLIDKYSDVRH